MCGWVYIHIQLHFPAPARARRMQTLDDDVEWAFHRAQAHSYSYVCARARFTRSTTESYGLNAESFTGRNRSSICAAPQQQQQQHTFNSLWCELWVISWIEFYYANVSSIWMCECFYLAQQKLTYRASNCSLYIWKIWEYSSIYS